MKKLSILFLFFCLVSSAQERQLGANLTDVSPFGTLWYYTNALKQSSGWLVYNGNNDSDPINLSSELTAELHHSVFDSQGYPLAVPFISDLNSETTGKSLVVSAIVLNNQPDPYFYPAGTYLLNFEGTGLLSIQGDVDGEYLEFRNSGSYEVQISDPTGFGLQLVIHESSPDDRIRNVELIFPDYVETYESERFQNRFLEIASEFEVLRFMKPLKSENNIIENFDDRSNRDDFAYFLDIENDLLPGMPYEDAIEIANATGTDLWVTIPYLATDEYISAMAALFNSSLSGDRKVYLEYSNETWNPAYPETRAYMLEMGENLVTTDIPEVAEFEAIHRFHALRSLEIFQIFEDHFDDDEQLVRVHGSQSDPFTAELVADAYELASVNPDDKAPDAVAIASYIGVTLFDDLRDQNIAICDHSPQDLLDTLRARILPEMSTMMTRYAELFGDTPIEIVAYEGGQHVTELNFQRMEPCAAALVAEMNRLPGMEDFFCEFLATWYDLGGGLFMVFNLAEGPDDFGSFGVLESQWQSEEDSPKWQGLMNCEDEEELLSTSNSEIETLIYPNPSDGTVYVKSRSEAKYELHSLAGMVMQKGDLHAGLNEIQLKGISMGTYLIKILSKEESKVIRLLVH